MDTRDSRIASSQNFDSALPSYETMIVQSLEHVGGNRGAAPKEIFNYMSNHWPLIPNFRPSASQALAKALKRGRLLKQGSLYTLNPAWTGGHTTPDSTQPSRHIAKRPASTFSPRSPPPNEHVIPTEELESTPGTPSAAATAVHFSPESKAVAQAIVSLLRPMIGDIKELAESQSHHADGHRTESSDSACHGIIATGLDEEDTTTWATGLIHQQHILSSSSDHSSQTNHLQSPLPLVIPCDDSETRIPSSEAHRSLLNNLENLSAYLRHVHTQ